MGEPSEGGPEHGDGRRAGFVDRGGRAKGGELSASRRRIAFAGGKTVLVPGTLRQNLLYGARETEGPETDRRLAEAARLILPDEVKPGYNYVIVARPAVA